MSLLLTGAGTPTDSAGGGGGGGTPATFVASSGAHINNSGGAVNVAYPAGTAVGNLVLLQLSVGSTSGETVKYNGGSQWAYLIQDTLFGSENATFAWHVVADAADLAHGVDIAGTLGDQTLGMTAYSGATTTTIKGSPVAVATTTISLAGFTPAGASAGVVIMSMDGGDGMVQTLSASPGTWANRLASHLWTNLQYAQDLLSGYAGAGVTASGYANTANKVAVIVELT